MGCFSISSIFRNRLSACLREREKEMRTSKHTGRVCSVLYFITDLLAIFFYLTLTFANIVPPPFHTYTIIQPHSYDYVDEWCRSAENSPILCIEEARFRSNVPPYTEYISLIEVFRSNIVWVGYNTACCCCCYYYVCLVGQVHRFSLVLITLVVGCYYCLVVAGIWRIIQYVDPCVKDIGYKKNAIRITNSSFELGVNRETRTSAQQQAGVEVRCVFMCGAYRFSVCICWLLMRKAIIT